jgi:hypothetical protein
MTVDKGRVQELVDALRSGDYEQGRSQLRFADKFCCLGVACDVAAKHGLGEWQESMPSSRVFTFVGDDRSDSVLPFFVRDWYGFKDRNPALVEYPAIFYNDSLGADFNQIADAFEEAYLND